MGLLVLYRKKHPVSGVQLPPPDATTAATPSGRKNGLITNPMDPMMNVHAAPLSSCFAVVASSLSMDTSQQMLPARNKTLDKIKIMNFAWDVLFIFVSRSIMYVQKEKKSWIHPLLNCVLGCD